MLTIHHHTFIRSLLLQVTEVDVAADAVVDVVASAVDAAVGAVALAVVTEVDAAVDSVAEVVSAAHPQPKGERRKAKDLD